MRKKHGEEREREKKNCHYKFGVATLIWEEEDEDEEMKKLSLKSPNRGEDAQSPVKTRTPCLFRGPPQGCMSGRDGVRQLRSTV